MSQPADARPSFRTRRLALRPRILGDIEACMAMDRDPEVTRFIAGPWSDPVAHRAFVEARIRHPYPPGQGYWSIIAPEGFAGWVLLTPLDLRGPEIEIGWRLIRAVWERGYATEAARPVLAHALTTLALPEIVADIDPRNTRSLAVARKLGMRLLGPAPHGDGRLLRYVAGPGLRRAGNRRRLSRMDNGFDAVVIGAGIAGASAAAALAADRRVALIEAEEQAGYHSTGRSAAIWVLNYGPADVRALTRLSRGFFESPPADFAETALMRRRPVLFLARPEQVPELDRFLADSTGVRPLAVAEAGALVPALRPGYAAAAAIEADAFDMDVAAIHQGFLRQLRARGGTLALRQRAGRIERRDGAWQVAASGGAVFRAPVVVDAAGAWADEVASMAGIRPLRLIPCRRTAAIIDPSPRDVSDWPLILDVGHGWYARPEARTQLMVSPADETPTHPHDVRPEEIDVALGIDRMQQALDIEVRRVERSWAGLRTFTQDGSLAFGWDRRAPGFFWCAGQGGYGIQTSPAAGRLVADLIAGRDPGAAAIVAAVDPNRFRR